MCLSLRLIICIHYCIISVDTENFVVDKLLNVKTESRIYQEFI